VQSVRPLRILIVDEYAPSLLVLSNVLRSRGHHCEGTTTAAAALARMRTFQPHVVLYEWNMPDGLGLAHSLRATATTPTPILIALSTIDEPPDFLRTEEIDAYLTKPLRIATLEQMLSTVGGVERQ